jgi:hypothetical protein
MAKGGKRRQGKVVTGGHSTKVEGLAEFCKELEKWPEITSIRLGRLSTRNTVGRRSKKLRTEPADSGFETAHGVKRSHGGGGFSFRAQRDAVVGSVVTGIKCDAANGTIVQEVVLCGDDLKALWRRLAKEGFHQ